MGRKNTRRSRNVYDPTLGVTDVDRLEKTNLFAERDPLSMHPAPDMEDIRNSSDVRDARFHNDDKSTRFKWKVFVPITLTALVLIIVIAVVASNKGGGSSSSETMFLQPPPNDLAEICAPEMVNNNPDDRQVCEEVCSWADCCNFPTSMDISCLRGNENRCHDYHSSCFILNEGTSVKQTESNFPPPPSFIDDICAKESLSTLRGRSNCAEICNAAACCYSKEGESCATDPSCEPYAPCLGLNAVEHTHEDISRLVNTKCDPSNLRTSNGVLECATVCEQSFCCFADENDAQCVDIINRSFCSQYEGCREIIEDSLVEEHRQKNEQATAPHHESYENWSSLPDVSQRLVDVCSADSIGSHRQECENLCDQAECCFADIEDSASCLDGNQYLCMEYVQACHVLVEDNVGIDKTTRVARAPENVDSVCSIKNLEHSADTCFDICAQAECCWVEGTATCAWRDECISYAMCLGLPSFAVFEDEPEETETSPHVITLPPPPADLADYCSWDALQQPGGRQHCASRCSIAECCESGECFQQNFGVCTQYKDLCAPLHQGENNVHLDEPPLDLGQFCASDNVRTHVGRSECQELCSAADCCTSTENSCYSNNIATCAHYQSVCKVLSDQEPWKIDPPPSNIDDICSFKNINTPGGKEDCEDICGGATCCDETLWGEDNCYAGNEESCETYLLECQILQDVHGEEEVEFGDQHLDMPPANLATVCSMENIVTAQGLEQCEFMCAPAVCCQTDLWGADACYAKNFASCEAYIKHCENLDSVEGDVGYVPGAGLVEQAPDNLPIVCALDSIRTSQGLAECQSVCDPGSCCRLQSYDSLYCVDENESVCGDYIQFCSILDNLPENQDGDDDMDTEGTFLLDPPADLDVTCGFESVSTTAGRAKCQQQCSGAACCDINWRDAGSCIQDNHAACQAYHAYCWAVDPNASRVEDPVQIPDAPSTIDQICSLGSLATQSGHNNCWEVCQDAACCWRDDVNSCAYESKCSEYNMCFGLKGIDHDDINLEFPADDMQNNGSLTAEQVNEVCGRVILTECEQICKPAECCSTGSCAVGEINDCAIYSACDILY